MSDELPPDQLPVEDPDEAAELAQLVVDDGKGGKVVPLGALIGSKKDLKAALKRIQELEPQAAENAAIRQRLDEAQPFITALVSDPKLRAEALRRTRGESAPTSSSDQDDEANEYAEDMGLYLADGQTPDSAKARRILDREQVRVQKMTERLMGPLTNLTLGEKATSNIEKAMAQTDDQGVPLASVESIREVAGQLPANLLADPRVVDLVLNNAMGLDRRSGRTPKAVEEPLYLDTPHGRRASALTIDADLKKTLTNLGLTEKEFHESSAQLDALPRGRR